MNRLFLLPLLVLALFTGGVLFALFFHLSPREIVTALSSEETRFALRLSLKTSLASTSLALVIGVPTGYFLARTSFPGKDILAALGRPGISKKEVQKRVENMMALFHLTRLGHRFPGELIEYPVAN